MTVSEKIKTINNKIEKNKAQCNLGLKKFRFEKVGKHKFLTVEDIEPGKNLLKKAPKIKRFRYSPVGIELKNKLTLQKKVS